jgi:hypothetical protein
MKGSKEKNKGQEHGSKENRTRENNRQDCTTGKSMTGKREGWSRTRGREQAGSGKAAGREKIRNPFFALESKILLKNLHFLNFSEILDPFLLCR